MIDRSGTEIPGVRQERESPTGPEARVRYEGRVRKLEGFGHRGSTTDREREAADYLAGELTALGLCPDIEPFAGYRSFGGRLLVPVLVATAGAAFLWHLPAVAAALGAIALVSLVVEQSSRGIVLSRLLPRRRSQNVTAILRGAGPTRVRLLVLGHYDTQRTSLLFRDTVWRCLAPVQRRLPVALQSPLLPVTFTMILQIALGVAASVNEVWTPPLVLVIVIFVTYVCAGALFTEFAVQPHVPGASDNASGAAGVLAVAERWVAAPMEGVEVVFLLPGCEEVGLVGAAAWVDRHRTKLRTLPTVFLNLDGLGFGPPHLLGREVPLAGFSVPYPPGLVATGVKVAAECEIADPGPLTVPGYTDGLALLARGVAGVTIVGCQPHGRLPHWHLPTDQSVRMDFDGAWRGVGWAVQLSRRLVQPTSGRV